MRRFSHGDGAVRKVVVIELHGRTMVVMKVKPDGSSTRQEQALPSDAAASAVADKLAAELLSHGYREHGGKKPAPATAAANGGRPAAKPRPVAPPPPPEPDGPDIFADLEPVESSAPPLARLAPLPDAAAPATTKKKKKTGKKKKAAKNPDALDKRVLGAVAAVALAIVGGAGYMAYDILLKPASIIGVWKGSMVEHEIGQSLTHTAYALTLDGARHASLSINDKGVGDGTYSVKKDRLTLKLKDEEGEEFERSYKFKVDTAALSLIDPDSGKLLVDLVRQFHAPESPAAGKAKAAAAAKDLADDGDRAANPDAERALASVEMSAKDGAFRLRHPPGWETQTGGKADNTYSYILLDKGAAKITVYADITGSLISGADSANAADFEEGSPFAPVHKAHEHYAKSGTEELGEYQESEPEVFKGTGFGEGRLSVFTASAGMFGGKLKGYHATVLNRDRRISVLAYGPAEDFPKLRATYLAVCRSLSP
ncbi:hypothetical protein [Paludisphaera sp.]|uniref:hypothetical protein n=1 Tax=Paludisphaera sp. TaxID=2017432 RepID=UPI00301C4154